MPTRTPTPLYMNDCPSCVYVGTTRVHYAHTDGTLSQWADWHICRPPSGFTQIVAHFSDKNRFKAAPSHFDSQAVQDVRNAAFFGVGRDLYEMAKRQGVLA